MMNASDGSVSHGPNPVSWSAAILVFLGSEIDPAAEKGRLDSSGRAAKGRVNNKGERLDEISWSPRDHGKLVPLDLIPEAAEEAEWIKTTRTIGFRPVGGGGDPCRAHS